VTEDAAGYELSGLWGYGGGIKDQKEEILVCFVISISF
jgi:hypothetical protein